MRYEADGRRSLGIMDKKYYIFVAIKQQKVGFITSYAISHLGNITFSEAMYLPKYTGPHSRLAGICLALQNVPAGSDVVLQTTDEYAKFAFLYRGRVLPDMKNGKAIKYMQDRLNMMNSHAVMRLKFEYLHERTKRLIHNKHKSLQARFKALSAPSR